MLHRDVSHNNIMFEMRDGEPHFILNDFDLAVVVNADGTPLRPPSSNHRTGTLPFMSIGLIDDIIDSGSQLILPGSTSEARIHRLRYDFESLLWVSLWCAMTMEPGTKQHEEEMIAKIASWQTGTFDTIRSAKRNLITDLSAVARFPFTPKFKRWRVWFVQWFSVIQKGEELLRAHDTLVALQRDDIEGDFPLPPALASQESLDLETLNGTITRDSIVAALKEANMATRLAS